MEDVELAGHCPHHLLFRFIWGTDPNEAAGLRASRCMYWSISPCLSPLLRRWGGSSPLCVLLLLLLLLLLMLRGGCCCCGSSCCS